MPSESLDHIEVKMLKALSRNDRATATELASMLPETSDNALTAAREKLQQSKLIEPVPGSTGQFQLTAKGADTAIDLPDDNATGSGGGRQHFG
jgi:hypothetical protein